MSSGDQDKQFEDLLGRHVRRSVRDDAPEDCPAADVLAAYHDRSLSPEEMGSSKQHIASCNSCQEILAQLEATDEVAVPEEMFDHVLQVVAVAPVAAVSRDEMAEDMAAATAAAGVRTASPISISSSRSPLPVAAAARRKYVRWMAPAGAIAAGLLLWVVVRDNQAPKLSPSRPVEIAENRRDSAGPPAQPPVGGDVTSADSFRKKDSASGTAPARRQRNEAGASAFIGGLSSVPARPSAKLSAEPKQETETLAGAVAASPRLSEEKRVPAATAKSVPLPPAAPPDLLATRVVPDE
ncbi:MAG TPA: hypothetical protein VK641_08020, partial [Terriglobales bacterium]|nr:hypothetical protein [Terriglobales bacterium]